MGDHHIQDTELGTAFDLVSAFCGMSEAQRVHTTLWAAGTYVFRKFPAFPRLDFGADEYGAGKTTCMQVVTSLCPAPLVFGHATQSSVKDWLDEHPETTIGLDERDEIFGTTGRRESQSHELKQLLNVGYAQNGKMLARRGGHSVQIPVYSAIALAGIGRAYPALMDRSVNIMLRKQRPELTWLSVKYEDGLKDVGKDIGEWVNTADSQETLASMPDLADIPGDVRHRLIMAPMAGIAHLAGCFDQFVESEHEIVTNITANPPASRSEMLVRDLAGLLPHDVDMVTMLDIRDLLRSTGQDSLWARITPGPVGDIVVRGLLREQGLETEVSNAVRGYRTDRIMAALAR
jgi:hypothetical protein